MEIWKAIPGWGGFYEVSNHGRVRSLDRWISVPHPTGRVIPRHFSGRILRPAKTRKGYLHVVLSSPDKKADIYIHHAVLLAFRGPCPKGLEVCHGDGNPANNALRNLRYDTSKANSADAKRHGRRVYMPCACPARCTKCGRERSRDTDGHYCKTRNCEWQHAYPGCTMGGRK